jgi:CCR4-NOT transcription complex subunit 1
MKRLAQYLVTRRASLEPNIHEIYITVVDAVGFPNFYRMVVDQTYENIKVLLASSKISTSSSERFDSIITIFITILLISQEHY